MCDAGVPKSVASPGGRKVLRCSGARAAHGAAAAAAHPELSRATFSFWLLKLWLKQKS